MNRNEAGAGGVSFTGLLFLLFLGLKLGKVIAWKWVWIFAPLWIPAVLVIFVLCIIGIFWWVSR